MSEETTKRVNCHKNGNLPLFCIEKDTRSGVLYAPFACALMAEARGFAPRHYSSSLVIALLLLYFSHFYYFIVAITRKKTHLYDER